MSFYWELKLSANELACLNACAVYTDELKKQQISVEDEKQKAERRKIWTETVYPVINTFRASCVVCRQLSGKGLSEEDNSDWRITTKGRKVLEIAMMDIESLRG